MNQSFKLPKILPGHPQPLGAEWNGQGINFAIYSENAEKVELCLFDREDSSTESQRFFLPSKTGFVWHGYVPHLKPGQLYGYRVYGPYDPENGKRFNSQKILLDPYAKGVTRLNRWNSSLFAYEKEQGTKEILQNLEDSAPFAPLGVVVDNSFNWKKDESPRHPWHRTVIYEMHVKGMTALHPKIPVNLRGTYAGLASSPVIKHLKSLGITAVELLPVHAHFDEEHLMRKNLKNYWGYNTIGFFAPEPYYAVGKNAQAVMDEFKMMVYKFHQSGIEVILDVVFNHTAEGNEMGPTLSFRAIDNEVYYRLPEDAKKHYIDYTGCGNTFNAEHPQVLKMIHDSLRYWVKEMRVDGFRFDLAPALVTREKGALKNLKELFSSLRDDPDFIHVKWIAEPWDITSEGYQLGHFPAGWSEWNDKYRDVVRRFWRGDEGMSSEFATRISGSSDLFEHSGRRMRSSINFVTCHDGFSLQDLVSFQQKHNLANGEDNRDGASENWSWNSGAEGLTEDKDILKFRERDKRNLMATLFLSQGIPMIRAGDELGMSQRGNNNPYCQDNEITWISWELEERQKNFLKYVKQLIAFRRHEAAFHRRKFFHGGFIRESDIRDVVWFDLSGAEMTQELWSDPSRRECGALMARYGIEEFDDRRKTVRGDAILILMNASHRPKAFQFDPKLRRGQWKILFDTSSDTMPKPLDVKHDSYLIRERSLVVLRRQGTSSPSFSRPLFLSGKSAKKKY